MQNLDLFLLLKVTFAWPYAPKWDLLHCNRSSMRHIFSAPVGSGNFVVYEDSFLDVTKQGGIFTRVTIHTGFIRCWKCFNISVLICWWGGGVNKGLFVTPFGFKQAGMASSPEWLSASVEAKYFNPCRSPQRGSRWRQVGNICEMETPNSSDPVRKTPSESSGLVSGMSEAPGRKNHLNGNFWNPVRGSPEMIQCVFRALIF